MRRDHPPPGRARAAVLSLLLLLALVASVVAAVKAAACPTGHYANQQGDCLPCDLSCKECDDGTSCFQCQTGLGFLSSDPTVPSLCTGLCPMGQFLNHEGTARCTPCGPSCLDCPYSDSQCSACAAAFGWENGLSPGSPRSTSPCIACPANCTTCHKADGWNRCHSCKPGAGLDGAGNCISTPTSDGRWLDEATGRLLTCDPTCAACSGPRAEDCTRCRANWRLEAVPAGGRGACVSDCPAGEYPSAGSPTGCAACHASCATCFGGLDNQCLSCRSGRPLQGQKCVLSCSDRHYEALGRCEQCHPACDQCTGPSNMDCVGACPRRLVSLTGPGPDEEACLTRCPERMGRGPADKCVDCGDHCVSCALASLVDPEPRIECKKCDVGWLLDHRSRGCVAECPPGTVAIGLECVQCMPSCAQCYGPMAKHCITCQPDHPFHVNGSCLASCPERMYPSSEGQCSPCDASCLTCSGPGSSQCTSCWQDQALTVGGRCATYCPAGEFRTDEPPSPGYVCGSCPDRCISCHDAKRCTHCNEDTFLHEGACHGACPSGTASCMENRQCERCPPLCDECTATMVDGMGHCRVECLACEEGLFLDPATGRCDYSCPDEQVPVDEGSSVCGPCAEGCLTCLGTVDRCTTCPESATWLRYDTSTCQEQCPEEGFGTLFLKQHYGMGWVNVCRPCPAGCDTCMDPKSKESCEFLRDTGRLHCPWEMRCQACAEPLLYLAESNTCTDSCPAGTFADPDARHATIPSCVKCPGGCLSCTGPDPAECTQKDKEEEGKSSKRRLAIGLGVGLGILALVLVAGAVAAFFILRGRGASANKGASGWPAGRGEAGGPARAAMAR
ncbi:hypothetical protein H696_04185 [Fonticula alba]|uniref:R-spondin Fu-CRD domain-containing protein n=1 Tax=Fonticula alba TaxID=691883 RepID=A0A058Z764_FONAL|nr:hypothetical protein H696_04185 [Fonticula alba]KCV69773.1 hypothetical protein H696_04185 [Fonticula alba]|eukprot:XP_009496338.1 hypothetical protein H696_04185 [Fonticula alba]